MSREKPASAESVVGEPDAAVKRAKDAGATVTLEPWDSFWGARYARIMELTARISAEKLAAKVGRTIDVLIDAVDEDGGATGRSKADAPEIDGEVHLRDAGGLKPGDIVRVAVEDADEHDLFGVPLPR